MLCSVLSTDYVLAGVVGVGIVGWEAPGKALEQQEPLLPM